MRIGMLYIHTNLFLVERPKTGASLKLVQFTYPKEQLVYKIWFH